MYDNNLPWRHRTLQCMTTICRDVTVHHNVWQQSAVTSPCTTMYRQYRNSESNGIVAEPIVIVFGLTWPVESKPRSTETSTQTIYTTAVEQELRTLPEHPSSSPVFSGVRVTRSLVLCVCFIDCCLSFCTFSFGHCVVCSSSIYEFWLLIWYLQTLLYSLWLDLTGGIETKIFSTRNYHYCDNTTTVVQIQPGIL
jgi:hypothetical protein